MFNTAVRELPKVTPLISAEARTAAKRRKRLVWKHRFKNSAEQRHGGSVHRKARLRADTQKLFPFLLEGKTHVLAHWRTYHILVSRDSRNHDP